MGDLDTMTDPEAKAREIVSDWETNKGDDDDVELWHRIATALREARTQALEEAARVADRMIEPSPISDVGLGINMTCQVFALRIRAIKEEYGASPAMAVLSEVRRDNAEKADQLRSALKDTTR
jgi:hypothetical protein